MPSLTPHIQQEKLNMALLDAVIQGDLTQIQAHLQAGAELDFNDDWPLEAAVWSGHLESIELLKAHWEKVFSKPFQVKTTSVLMALQRNYLEMVSWTLPFCNIHDSAEMLVREAARKVVHFQDPRFFEMIAPQANLTRAFTFLLKDAVVLRDTNRFHDFKEELLVLWNHMGQTERDEALVCLKDEKTITPYLEQIVLMVLPSAEGQRSSPRL